MNKHCSCLFAGSKWISSEDVSRTIKHNLTTLPVYLIHMLHLWVQNKPTQTVYIRSRDIKLYRQWNKQSGLFSKNLLSCIVVFGDRGSPQSCCQSEGWCETTNPAGWSQSQINLRNILLPVRLNGLQTGRSSASFGFLLLRELLRFAGARTKAKTCQLPWGSKSCL